MSIETTTDGTPSFEAPVSWTDGMTEVEIEAVREYQAATAGVPDSFDGGLRACGYQAFAARLTELDDSGDLDAALQFAYGCADLLSMTEQECEWCQEHHPAPMHCAYCGDALIADAEGIHEVYLQAAGYCPCCEHDEIEHHLLVQYLEDGGA